MSERDVDKSVASPDGHLPKAFEALDALERALESKSVARRARLGALLSYIVDEEMEGRGERLKAFTIAMDVFDRDEDFDPQSDSIVRVEMFRLRKALEQYYADEGARDPLRIDIPRGSYRPTFVVQKQSTVMPDENPTVEITAKHDRLITMRVELASCAAVLLVAAGYLTAEIRIDRMPDGAPEPTRLVSDTPTQSQAILPASYRSILGTPRQLQWRPQITPERQVP